AGTILFQQESWLTTVSDTPSGCANTGLRIDTVPASDSFPIAKGIDPSTVTLPKQVGALGTKDILTTATQLEAYFTPCFDVDSNPIAGIPGGTGKILLSVEFPPTLLP
ncbi:MAG: hypothetical protein P4L84_31030, partial [Isosphaeraceae bacterium]|nr:hypothetical protein [Isosphaeraceae bacterium]